jgi:hypothetical protein
VEAKGIKGRHPRVSGIHGSFSPCLGDLSPSVHDPDNPADP